MKKIYLVRNAEAVANIQARFCKSSPLTETGRIQAHHLASYLSKSHIKELWSSPCEHAFQTAKIIGDTIQLSVKTTDDISNIDTGQWEGLTVPEIKLNWPLEWRRIKNGILELNDKLTPEGETLEKFYSRVTTEFGDILEKMKNGSIGCLVGHNLSVAAILTYVVNAPAQCIFRFEQYNCALNLIEISGYHPRIVYSNYVGFLEEAGISIRPGAISNSP